MELLKHEALQEEYDVVLATSTVDIPTIRAVYPDLAKVWNVYFHENQFAYPSKRHDHFDMNLAMRDVKRARVADRVAFNSAFNRDSFLAGLRKLIKITPGGFGREILENIEAKSIILPVGLDDSWLYDASSKRESGPLRILWNHRWEYDKGPEVLLDLVKVLRNKKVQFELYLAGQDFRTVPEAFSRLREDYSEHLRQFGKVESFDDYRKMVYHCDIVLSTAIHEFQGLAMLETIAAGCIPFAPNRLVYPEYIPAPLLYEDVEELAAKLESFDLKNAQVVDVERYKWSGLKASYLEWLSGTI